ncbi:membrane protein [Tremella mesenterica]|uniref:Membrane protein n=1 Tax=Tremella mesenterica TaxID=5217 RepID=A0A4Q1BBP2_TREME|nr:membrane protein [Tremella mesenterica]
MRRLGVLLLLLTLSEYVLAHNHHNITEIDTSVPFDAIIYTHMSLQTFLWGISFPIGMVLGLSKSKYHVPLQSVNVVLNYAGQWMGHHHGGRQFPATVHGIMARILFWTVLVQAGLGIFLKLHVLEKNVRKWVIPVHSVIGKAFPILGWTQMLFGVATALGYCRGGDLGQCLAHYIMGSAFIAYAVILVIMLNLGGHWLERIGCSQEMLDSSTIMVWGIVNTFTEHHGGAWSHKDMQHTMLGVLWWTGGMLGVFLSRKGKRSFVPAIIIIMTGWGMSAHEQALMISSKIHALFGYALIAAGVLRLVEICFVLNDQATPHGIIRVFQHLPPYLLVLGGTLFMSATDEELRNVDNLGIDHVSYALFDFSLSFLIYLIITFLVHLYLSTGANSTSPVPPNAVEEGYAKIPSTSRRRTSRTESEEGAEVYELTEQDDDEDATKIGHEDEVDWIGRQGPSRLNGVRI